MAYEYLDELHEKANKLDLVKDKLLAFENSTNKSQLVYAKLVDDLKAITGIDKDE